MKIQTYEKAEKIVKFKRKLQEIIDHIEFREGAIDLSLSEGIRTSGFKGGYIIEINPNIRDYVSGKIRDVGNFNDEFKRFLRIYKMNLLDEVRRLDKKLENIGE